MAGGQTFGALVLAANGKVHLFEISPGSGDVRTLCGQIAPRPARPRTYDASPAKPLLEALRRLGPRRCSRCVAKVQLLVGAEVRSFDRALRYGTTPMDPNDRPTVEPVVTSRSAPKASRIRLSGARVFHVFTTRTRALCGASMEGWSHHHGRLTFETLAEVLHWLDEHPEKLRCQRCLSVLESRVHPER